jgi:starch synthase
MLIWMAAAENDALPGGKVGGVGDVMRDLPTALAAQGHRVVVFTPSYGRFHHIQGSERTASIRMDFAGRSRVAALYRVPSRTDGIEQYVIEHSLITARQPGRIYFDDGASDPFASDATRFSFFSAAIAAWTEQTAQPPDVLHAHDWHLGALFFLRRFGRGYRALRRARCVFSIHNLAYQGIRPLRGHPSALESWFPQISYTRKVVRDTRYADCANLMAISLRLADGINTVSPGYAREILLPSDPRRGFVGGEGLETDLQAADADGRLSGILNGCFYPEPPGRRPGWKTLLDAIERQEGLADPQQLSRLPRRRPRAVLTSIGRITDQKSTLFLQETASGQTALEAILDRVGGDAVLIMLGSGDRAFEQHFATIAAKHDNFLFLRGYAESLSDVLYRAGDLFLMPSSFEPCGISQMLSMRAGQPCVVHAVGGLRDTVHEGVTGFRFSGSSPRAQARQFVAAVARALRVKEDEPSRWRDICRAASEQRFTWRNSAQQYVEKLYAL